MTETLDTWQQSWSSSSKGRDTFQLFPKINLKRIHGNFYINQVITAHGVIGLYQSRCFNTSPVCSCGTSDEDRSHIVFQCPQWANIRKQFFPSNFINLTLLQLLSNKKARTGVEAIMKIKLEKVMKTLNE
ncbi:uncharacterized protein CDAR_84041 [Caerostris darwini]|uniref:Reverse transcriptase zinc-binding domain-containing protein n=1 Tax=Caerostris darwini TaxID=1538125 RepID=A0AAV4X530_9ARAC|nr:uncharacterized protein CDAR_84041 [Caerostris darwini]